jgi:hypothetical protein
MPRTCKSEAPLAMDSAILTSRGIELDEFTVVFEEFHVDADGTPMFRGLPDDRCQCPHWGLVVAGEMRMRYVDGEESYREGDAYVARPGHIPLVTAGTEIIEFSPTHLLQETLAVLEVNMAEAMRSQS